MHRFECLLRLAVLEVAAEDGERALAALLFCIAPTAEVLINIFLRLLYDLGGLQAQLASLDFLLTADFDDGFDRARDRHTLLRVDVFFVARVGLLSGTDGLTLRLQGHHEGTRLTGLEYGLGGFLLQALPQVVRSGDSRVAQVSLVLGVLLRRQNLDRPPRARMLVVFLDEMRAEAAALSNAVVVFHERGEIPAAPWFPVRLARQFDADSHICLSALFYN